MNNSQAIEKKDNTFDHILRIEIDDGIAVGTIDQDGRAANVIDQDMLDALEAFVERVLTDDTIRGAIITSGKATFVAGADLNGIEASLRQTERLDPETQFERNFSLSRILRRLETGGKPFACALNGIAMGGGLEIALACHYRVAADDPRLIMGLPEVQVGLLPGGGGTQRMLRLLGIFQAMPLLLEGKILPAVEALELGLLHSLAPRDQLVDRARQWILSEPDTVALWDQEGYVVPGGTPSDNPKVAEALVGSRHMLMAKTHGRYPAPLAILSCIEEGSVLPIDDALRLECQYFTQLNNDPTATAMMRTLFVNKTKADKLV
ncbi:MAG: 3-hydroxyacyl-CoA dehydrogenase, partial [Gammaproteobacteria bacterium]|nr:3-hydroxyacyl-CoA dehydrogenase [Gammaproteobacteria bacterium]